MTSQKKILIVDDEQINLEFFELMLTRLGFIVDKAENGREALDVVKRFNPDLVMLDNIMPVMSGWEFTKVLKFSDDYLPWSETPVIMFSALDDVKNKIEGFELGIDDYITKPFNFSEVLARMKAVLKNHELIIQLKKREERLDAEYRVNACLMRHVEEMSSLLRNMYDSAELLTPDGVQRLLSCCIDKYDTLKTEVTVLEERGSAMKNDEIETFILEKELRRAYSNQQ